MAALREKFGMLRRVLVVKPGWTTVRIGNTVLLKDGRIGQVQLFGTDIDPADPPKTVRVYVYGKHANERLGHFGDWVPTSEVQFVIEEGKP